MKRFISIITALVMLVSMVAVSTSADGVLYVDADFTDMNTFTGTFHAGAYFVEDSGVLFGYSEAKCLQSKGEWFVYDTEIEIMLADDDVSEGARAYSLWYCNTNLESYGWFDGTDYMRFGYDIENRELYLTADDPNTYENIDLVDRVPYEIEDNVDVRFGLSVTRGRLRCFINDELVIDYIDEKDDYLIGLQDENTISTPLVFWNDNNFVQIKDVKIASAEYLYPMFEEEVTTAPVVNPGEGTTAPVVNPGENTQAPGVEDNKPEDTKAPEIVTKEEIRDVTDDKGNTVTDESGEKVTEKVIVSETVPQATNTGKPAGGSSTATGDASFVVVAVMVATIGCALIVRKVNA